MEKLSLIKMKLQEDIEQLEKLRIQKMVEVYEAEKASILAIWNEKLDYIIGKRKGFVMISFLRSSYITRHHKFKIAFYEKDLFVEENPPAFSYSATLFLEGVEEDIEYLWKKTEREFIQVFSWRKEELRRIYMEKIYKACVIIFRSIISEMDRTGKEIGIFYGEEIGYVEQIGIIGSERIR